MYNFINTKKNITRDQMTKKHYFASLVYHNLMFDALDGLENQLESTI